MVQQEEEHVSGLSPTSFWRSTLAQLHVYPDRPAPTCCFLLLLATWAAGLYRMFAPEAVSPQDAGVCLLPQALFRPSLGEWFRYMLHAFWPMEPGLLRGALTSTLLVLQGYACEYEMGTSRFVGLLVCSHGLAAALLLYLRLTVCFVSLDAALAGMALVCHRVNPKIHTNGLDPAVRLPFAVEPRWHIWALLALKLLAADNFPYALATYGAGLLAGGLCLAREPQAWSDVRSAFRRRSAKIGLVVHVAGLMFVMVFVPLTLPESVLPNVYYALTSGSALDVAWWRSLPSSPPLLHLSLMGVLGGELPFIVRLLFALSVPLLLSPFLLWSKVYAGACVLILMYTMNSGVWGCPHLGFVSLVYFVWAFWKLPLTVYWERHVD